MTRALPQNGHRERHRHGEQHHPPHAVNSAHDQSYRIQHRGICMSSPGLHSGRGVSSAKSASTAHTKSHFRNLFIGEHFPPQSRVLSDGAILRRCRTPNVARHRRPFSHAGGQHESGPVSAYRGLSCVLYGMTEIVTPTKSTDILVAPRQICREGQNSQRRPTSPGQNRSPRLLRLQAATFAPPSACSPAKLRFRGVYCAKQSTKCSSPNNPAPMRQSRQSSNRQERLGSREGFGAG